MNKKNLGCLLMVLGMIVAIFSLLFGIDTVYAASLQDTQTPTRSATPKGTSTPYPTNQSPTPGAGSGCPEIYPTLMSASYYKNCRVCFDGMENPLIPTVTGTLQTSTPTKTPTKTPTPSTLWFGVSALQSGTQVYTEKGSTTGWIEKSWLSANVCGAPSRIMAVKFHHYRNFAYEARWYFGDTFYQNSLNGIFDGNYLVANGNSTMNNAMASIFSGWSPYTIHWVQASPGGEDKFTLGLNTGYEPNNIAYFDNVQFACKNYAYQDSTPTPTPEPTKICVTPKNVKVITKMDTFARGLERVDDDFISYYRIFPYDVGSYKSLYERDLYNKEFEVSLKTSGATYFDFVQSEEDVNVLYGKHKIDFYDCSDRLIGTYTSKEGNDETKHWAFTQPVSLCRVHVETIDDGLEKQFSAKGVITDGCQQVNCDSTNDSGRGYQFDEDSPIGIDIGGWAEYNQCRMLFDGFDMALIRNPIQGLLDYANIDVTLPEFPNIPWIQLCVQYWRMPVIKYFELEIPIGNILLFIAVMFTFGNPIGNGKGK